MWLYRSDAVWLEREKDIRADAVIVSMSPTKLSRHGCIPAEPAAVSPGKIIVPRIVIGGVILDQPAGGGIGPVGVGSLCGYGGHGRSLGCYKCGSGDILILSKLKTSIVTCNSCHANLGKWGDIEASALRELTKIVKEL